MNYSSRAAISSIRFFIHRLGLLHCLHPLQLGLKPLQLLLDAGKLEVVLAVIVLGQGFSDEVFPLFLQLIYFGTYDVLAVRCFRGQHRADALHGNFQGVILVDVLF